MYASVYTLRSELQSIVQKLRGIFALQISKNLIQKFNFCSYNFLKSSQIQIWQQKYDKIYFDSTLQYILVVPLNAT